MAASSRYRDKSEHVRRAIAAIPVMSLRLVKTSGARDGSVDLRTGASGPSRSRPVGRGSRGHGILAACGQDHPLALHAADLRRLQVRNDDELFAHELCRRERLRYASNYLAHFTAEIHHEPVELVCALHGLRAQACARAELQLGEVLVTHRSRLLL